MRTSALPRNVRRSVTVGRMTAVAGQPAGLSNTALATLVANANLPQQNAVANQQTLAQVAQAVSGKALRLVLGQSLVAAYAQAKLVDRAEVRRRVRELRDAVVARKLRHAGR